MFKKNILALLSFATLLPFLSSCNVHEWPHDNGETFPFILYLTFDQDLPLYKEVYYTRNGEESRAEQTIYDIRYVVNVYKVTDENDANREVFTSFTFSRQYTDSHDYQTTLSLPEGKYRFRVWSDHVTAGTQADLFYKTNDFTEIILDESKGHPGNNEMRDAFRGSAYGEVYDPELYEIRHNGKTPENSATALMQRPMGRYEFISTDMDEFLDKAIEGIDATRLQEFLLSRGENPDTRGEVYWNGLTRDEVADVLGLDHYQVVFSYNAFMPSSYNFFTDRPSDSSTGISFQGGMSIGDDGMQMGFDYVLTDQETTMNLNMQIYNSDGTLIASSSGIEVPIQRSKNTIVKGKFLTVTSGGGVTINPDFEGDDYNIEIK
ncbi:MAG: hypothetical protein J1D77_08290 [Muribaculaceae bacterium]|nr:hypothetical protein [Muribaculaceae bacterium]